MVLLKIRCDMSTKLIIILNLLIILTGCDLLDNFRGGNIESRRFNINTSIDHIKVNNTFDITLVQDNSSFVDITCGENFQPKVVISIKEKTLMLNHGVNYQWINGYEKIKLEIHIPNISSIDVYKPSKIQTLGTFNSTQFRLIDWGNFIDCNLDVSTDFLRVDSSGDSFGSYSIKGSAIKSVFYCRGSAKFSCTEFQTDTCQISQESILDLSISVKNFLDVRIESTGNVFYTGNPTINLTRNGKGELIKL
ncbi:MAG: hypothetical protein F9K37_04740 [Bacteroidales bacterium]|nr:MAG: hypothetical protein F9K37_04740 [Bacteroidales bacterium]